MSWGKVFGGATTAGAIPSDFRQTTFLSREFDYIHDVAWILEFVSYVPVGGGVNKLGSEDAEVTPSHHQGSEGQEVGTCNLPPTIEGKITGLDNRWQKIIHAEPIQLLLKTLAWILIHLKSTVGNEEPSPDPVPELTGFTPDEVGSKRSADPSLPGPDLSSGWYTIKRK